MWRRRRRRRDERGEREERGERGEVVVRTIRVSVGGREVRFMRSVSGDGGRLVEDG